MQPRYTYGVGFALMGVVLTLIQVTQGIQQLQVVGPLSDTDQLLVFGFGTVPFVLVALVLLYLGYWLTDQPTFEQDLPQILAWGAGSTLLFASIGALILFSQQITIGTLEGGQYVIVNQVTVGAAVGVLVGIYDARGRARKRELVRERNRIETFAGKAADINNYGRELNRANSIDEVSALCIEALQTLLELTESCFVVVDGEDREVTNSTIVNVGSGKLADVAADATDQEQATVESRAANETDIDRDGRILSIVVTQHDDSAVVLLAVTGDRESFPDEDIQLLELLLSHAGTTLDRIHSSAQSR